MFNPIWEQRKPGDTFEWIFEAVSNPTTEGRPVKLQRMDLGHYGDAPYCLPVIEHSTLWMEV